MKLQRHVDSVLPIISSGHSAKFTGNHRASSEGRNHPKAGLESRLLHEGKEEGGGASSLSCLLIRNAWSGDGPAFGRRLAMADVKTGKIISSMEFQ